MFHMLKLDYPEFLLTPLWWYLVVIPLEVINERGHISHVLVSFINMGCTLISSAWQENTEKVAICIQGMYLHQSSSDLLQGLFSLQNQRICFIVYKYPVYCIGFQYSEVDRMTYYSLSLLRTTNLNTQLHIIWYHLYISQKSGDIFPL